jgi:mannosyltransferase OCH1-like enzyme
MCIPKNIYQVIIDHNGITSEIGANINILRSLNPDWKYTLFDDKAIIEFILKNYGTDELIAYSKINASYGAAKVDFFRYLLIYNMGGVYLDIKSTAIRPLNEILKEDDEYLLSYWRNNKNEEYEGWGLRRDLPYPGTFQQWHVIAAPNHPFLRNVISQVKNNIHNYDIMRDGVGEIPVLKTTGPDAYTKAILPMLGAHKHRIIDAYELGLRYSFLDPDNMKFKLTGQHAHAKFFAKHYHQVQDRLVVPLSRNSPCPCGSGKKYKQCHGRLA